MVHEAASEGFGRGAGAYERGRPSYPEAAVAFVVEQLGIGPASTVVDLAAGTGKFTRLLAPTGARLVAVEPVEAMRAGLAATLPGVEVVDGVAEAMPLPDGSADALVVAQAFHWFDHAAALAEVARVLRPGAGFALVWNRRDESVPWVARMSEIIGWHTSGIPRYDGVDWAAVVAGAGAFTPLGLAEFAYEQLLDRAGLAERVRSVSYVARMPEVDQQRLAGEVVALADGFPETFALPYRTLVHWCHRR